MRRLTNADRGQNTAIDRANGDRLVQQLGFAAIGLVAYDITGRVSYAYAAAHPDAVRHLVLMEILLPGFGLEAQ